MARRILVLIFMLTTLTMLGGCAHRRLMRNCRALSDACDGARDCQKLVEDVWNCEDL